MRYWRQTAAAILLLGILTGCGSSEAPASQETPTELQKPSAESVFSDSGNTAWLPNGIESRLAQTEHLPELAAVIAEAYGIPEEEWSSTRYYYDYVDLNDDGTDEILAVAVGMYTSGSGGDSAILVHPDVGMNPTQQFTLIHTPILVSDQTTDGAHDLIFLRGGGGSEPALVRLTCTDGVYSNPADAEILENLDGITGTAILCDDLMADLESGTSLTLAGQP